MTVELTVDGNVVTVHRDQVSLLAALRDELGIRAPKDGCSPQGQCGCCTVLVDGAARVACVTAVKRVAGRSILTSDGLDPAIVRPLVARFRAAGASQCGFCTPGILCRLAGLGSEPSATQVENALLAHLCRCTGWRGIVEAATGASSSPSASPSSRVPTAGLASPPLADRGSRAPADPGSRAPADQRATIEGRTPQRTGSGVVAGHGGFADDAAPRDALVAVPDGRGGWALGESVAEARQAAGQVQGRRSGHPPTWPVAVPAGQWDLTLQTSWIEPGYLEPDASWCIPGGVPASPVVNGGAFGAKSESLAPAAARMLADHHGRPVRVLYAREDVVRLGPKRPPVAVGASADGTGVIRVVRAPGVADILAGYAPWLRVEEVDVAGPTTSSRIRAAGWAEAAVIGAALVAQREGRVATSTLVGVDSTSAGTVGWASIVSPEGASARADVHLDAAGLPLAVGIEVACGDPLDDVVLRSYATGAAHMALGWVLSEGIAVDDEGQPEDLTMRSWGILRAKDTPAIEVRLAGDGSGRPVNGSDAVFAAVAAAVWITQGLPPAWPTRRGAFR
jgi:xanthine dehydrogenase small subunit